MQPWKKDASPGEKQLHVTVGPSADGPHGGRGRSDLPEQQQEDCGTRGSVRSRWGDTAFAGKPEPRECAGGWRAQRRSREGLFRRRGSAAARKLGSAGRRDGSREDSAFSASWAVAGVFDGEATVITVVGFVIHMCTYAYTHMHVSE